MPGLTSEGTANLRLASRKTSEAASTFRAGLVMISTVANLHYPPLDGFELPLTPDAELPVPVVLVPGIGEIAPFGL